MIQKFETLKDIVIHKYKEFENRVAFSEKDKKTNEIVNTSYSELRDNIFCLGTAMYEKLKIKDYRVAVIGENSSKWYTAYMAVACGNGIIVPLDKELPSNEVLNLLERSNTKCIIYSSKKKDVIDELRDKLPKDMIYIDMHKEASDDISYSYDSLIKEGKELLDTGHHEYMELKIDPNEFKILLFTSGTTSKSKGVMLSNNNLTSNIYSMQYEYLEQACSRYLSILPMHHTYEFTATYLATFASGGSVCISDGLKYLNQNFKEFKPQSITCVPLLVEKLKLKIEKTIREENKDTLTKSVMRATSILGGLKVGIRRSVFKKVHENFGGELKYIIIGGAMIDKVAADYMEGLGFTIISGYGLTETSPLIAGTKIKHIVNGTVGSAIKNVEVRIELNEDEEKNIGEIIVKGPNVMLGYYQDEEETKKVMKKGWFYTGDLGYFDSKGNLVITGRTKNVIVTNNGKNIYPEEIELLINKIALVEESLVYGFGEEKDIVVAAKVTLNESYIEETFGNNRPSDEMLRDLIWEEIKKINRTVVSYKAIKKVEIQKEPFEKTTTMKIKRFANKDK